jgi:hypothetical protein
MFVALLGGACLLVLSQGTHPPLQLVIQFQFGDAAQYVHGFSQGGDKTGIECGN